STSSAFFFSSRRRHTRFSRDWSSDVCSSDLIVTPNKKANSASMEYTESLRAARRQGGSHYLYEGTVGAGLPVIQTVRDLRETGRSEERRVGKERRTRWSPCH